jgi:glycosyltransferase involved in cell wall biosynthesis
MDHSLPKTDGYAIRAKYMLEAQAVSGHQVTVLTSPSQGPEAADMQVGGVSYRRSHYSKVEKKMAGLGGKHLVFGRATARGLSALLARDNFDLVHAHTPFTVARIALREARRRRLPFVYEKRNLWEESARARGKTSGRWPWFQVARAMDRWVTLRADAVCTITEALKTHTVNLGAHSDRVFVVGNGVDTSAFAPRPAPVDLRARCAAGGNFVIGFVGSFFSFEGLPTLVEAFARLRPRYPGARLVLVGDGEDRAKIERLAVKLNLGQSIWLVGSVPHARVVDFYAAMDVLVYPRYRSMLTDMISPLKPLEPMAMAKCVLGSDVSGIRELLRDGEAGLLFSAGEPGASPGALEAKLELLLSGQVNASAMGGKAREHVFAHRQWRQMAQAYEGAYQCARARATF